MVTVTTTTFDKLASKSYNEARREFFVDKYNDALHKMRYWSARVNESQVVNDKAHDLSSDWGAQVSYYNDVLEALDQNNIRCRYKHHRCQTCGKFALITPNFCPNCGGRVIRDES